MELVRLSFADQHGILRGKTIRAGDAPRLLRSGCPIPASLLLKDTSHRTVFPVFTPGAGLNMREMEGAADLLMVPIPSTFKALPWANNTGWVLCDLYFASGRPVPLSTRQTCRTILSRLREVGFDLIAGLEVELHIFKVENPRLTLADAGQPGTPPDISLLTRGYQYHTEICFDQIEPILEIIDRNLAALGLPPRSLELEFGPSQCELTFAPAPGLESADSMVLLRSAIKQICQRAGYLATFMCRPGIPNVMSSGWHLHQSLRDRRTGGNAFVGNSGDALSTVGHQYLAGLLEHASATTIFAAPTINAYRRYRPHSMAPDRAIWGRDNRGVMVRVIGEPGDPATHLENRVGEPAANPYLYIGSQACSGLDGIRRQLQPGPPADTPYEAKATMLPKTLAEAVQALRSSDFLRREFGAPFIDYYIHIKEAELARFNLEVSAWEHREYLELF
jgi:glutamine synthetase